MISKNLLTHLNIAVSRSADSKNHDIMVSKCCHFSFVFINKQAFVYWRENCSSTIVEKLFRRKGIRYWFASNNLRPIEKPVQIWISMLLLDTAWNKVT